MHLKAHLDDVAQELGDRRVQLPADLDEAQEWQRLRRRSVLQQWGLEPLLGQLGSEPESTVTGVTECETHRIERLWFRSLDGLVVTGNLYVPHSLTKKAPAILYLCGHSPIQKVHYQDHARRFAQLGFVTLIVDTVQYSEIPGHHRGTYNEGAFHWISRGYSPAAVEAWNAMRAIDLLVARDDVDPSRIGVTGHSGGGVVSWWVAAVDPRVKAIASSSGTGGEVSHIRDHTLDGHCDCYFPSMTDGSAHLEMYALVVPRPVLIVAPQLDKVYNPASVDATFQQLRPLYDNYGQSQAVRLLPIDAGHRYTPESRREIFAWMLTHVAGQPTRADDVEDVDDVRHDASDLHVFSPGQQPPANSNDTVADWFLAPSPRSNDLHQVQREIRQVCLGFTPPGPPSPEPRVVRSYERDDAILRDFTFTPERGWQLKGIISQPLAGPAQDPLPVLLRSPSDNGARWWTKTLQRFPASEGWAILDVRGTGDTAWHPSLTWHLRRAAAVLGRSIASMRIWDVLCGVETVCQLTQRETITLRAEGDLTVPALFAAVLDRRVVQVETIGLPPTLDSPTDPDGQSDVVEIPHALRITDIPQLLELVSVTQLDREVPVTRS